MPADLEAIPANGDHNKRTVTEHFDKSKLDNLSNVRDRLEQSEQLKSCLLNGTSRHRRKLKFRIDPITARG